jgi:hypothetical protein
MYFAAWMFDAKYSPGTIQSYLAALPSFYATLGIKVSISRMECPSLSLLLRGVRRTTSHTSKPKLPFTPSILLRFREHLKDGSNRHRAIWACLLVGFWGFLRSDNLVPKSSSLFDTSHALLKGDISFMQG